jgi:hypothetical protein
MTTNRLARSEAPTKRSSEEWCDIGNAHLASIGRAHEVHWFVHDGKATIGWKR